jgi:hypothetical protein
MQKVCTCLGRGINIRSDFQIFSGARKFFPSDRILLPVIGKTQAGANPAGSSA